MPATWSIVTVRSLSVSQYVGAPPKARMARSKQATTVGSVRSQVGITTRNLDHANHAQKRFVARPSMSGPVPQSHWAHIPGSGIQGRYTRRRPAPERPLGFRDRSAHRAVRAVEPERLQLAGTDIGADLALERSTHSSIFGNHGSMIRSRRTGPSPGNRPSSRLATYAATV